MLHPIGEEVGTPATVFFDGKANVPADLVGLTVRRFSGHCIRHVR